MGVFKILGTGCCYDQVTELSYLSEAMVRRFFAAWIDKFVEVEFDLHVYPPLKNEDEIKRVTSVYSRVGLPGCIGSVDCVHLAWGMCPNDCICSIRFLCYKDSAWRVAG